MPTLGFDSITFRDYDSELSNVRVNATVLTAANFDAQATLRNAFVSAMQAISLGVKGQESFGNQIVSSLSPAGNDAAQREQKWLVQYHDSTSLKRFSFEIPCADTGALDANDRAHAEIGDSGVVDAFVAAAEAYVLSPDGGAIVIDEITLVGRAI